jgi:Uma2 family endonuclease
MATVTTPPSTRQRVVLYDADWKTYTRLLRVFAERPRVKLTYDRGVLEIMSPLHEHEYDTELIARLVVVLTEELDLPIHAGGSTTFRRRRHQKGLEPDRCWWIASESRVRGKRRINLKTDPPPDLALETDVSHSSQDRMGIYAKLQVPEVWRLDEQKLTFFHLVGKQYVEFPRSLAFPMIAPADLMRFLLLRNTLDDNAIVRQFRDWLRQQVAAQSRPPVS